MHRVQRVPVTESGGRIHTSAATVAVLPEAEEVDVQIDDKDLRIDVYRSSGPGGQSVNTTDSAVRITHLPTGPGGHPAGREVAAQEQGQGAEGAAHPPVRTGARAACVGAAGARKSMVGSGDRSERIRTYNFPQGRVTDHRINLTLHKLDAILEGPGLASWSTRWSPRTRPSGWPASKRRDRHSRGAGPGDRAAQQDQRHAAARRRAADGRALASAAIGCSSAIRMARRPKPFSSSSNAGGQASRSPISPVSEPFGRSTWRSGLACWCRGLTAKP